MHVTNALNFSDSNAVTFGAAKFWVDGKEGGGRGGEGDLTLSGEEVNTTTASCVTGRVRYVVDYMIPGRLCSSRREVTLVPSYGSVFVHMIPPQNVMPARDVPARVIPARVRPGSCAGARFSSRHENSFRWHVNAVWLFVSYLLKFHQFYGTNSHPNELSIM